jgi:hypothetical protein
MKTADDIEKDFDRFFATKGFRRVSELVGHSPDFPNADYINESTRCIVELKVIDTDYFAEGGFIDRFSSFVPKPISVDERGFGVYRVAVPDLNREGRMDTFEEPMRRLLKKSNRQLRESVARLLAGDGFGFVWIAMNGFTSLHPEVVARMINALLDREFSSIVGYTLCTPTWGLIPPNGGPVEGCCRGSVVEGAPSSLAEYWHDIGQSWCYFADLGGHA